MMRFDNLTINASAVNDSEGVGGTLVRRNIVDY